MKNFKFIKEELIAIPLLMVFVEITRQLLMYYFPNSAFFDPVSELETYLVKVWQFLWLSSASWLLLRVVFPDAFNAMKSFYTTGFNNLPADKKEMIGFKIFFVILFLLIFLFTGGISKATPNKELVFRKKFCEFLEKHVGITEQTNKNDGPEIDKFLSAVGVPSKNPWCGAYAGSRMCCLNIPNPMSGRAAMYATEKDRVKKPQPGDCFTLQYGTRVGHVGFFLKNLNNQYFTSNEGNIGIGKGKEGVGNLKIDKRKVYAYTNYITPHLHNSSNYKPCKLYK